MASHLARHKWHRIAHRVAFVTAVCLLTAGVLLSEIGAERACAQPSEREVDAAIERGVGFLKSLDRYPVGTEGLVAYSLLSAGVPADDRVIQTLIRRIRGKVKNGKYDPGRFHHYYEAGVDLMAWEKADPVQYRPEIVAATQYILEGQLPSGAWFYWNPKEPKPGDTSITQYAVLGLWAASRSGVDVPTQVWDRMAAWLTETQMADGSFTYQPPEPRPISKHSMTVAGVACQYIALMHMGGIRPPEADAAADGKDKPKPENRLKFGVLERVDLDSAPLEDTAAAPDARIAAASRGPRRSSNDRIRESIRRGVDWYSGNYDDALQTASWPRYYLYGLERMAAVGDLNDINGNDWYVDGLNYLMPQQQQDGSWRGTLNTTQGTCFAVLFLSRATGQIVGKAEVPVIGGGLLVGGRGLPDNLAEVQMRGGEVKTQEISGPVGELLAELENPQSVKIEDAQAALVAQVQIGDREGLIGQIDRLVELLDDPRPEVRRTALWALSRTDDIRVGGHIIGALDDNNADVLVEARNALCWLSRRPLGMGLPESPLADLDEDATDAERNRALEKWRSEAIQRWSEWYAQVKPYDERDGVSALGEK